MSTKKLASLGSGELSSPRIVQAELREAPTAAGYLKYMTSEATLKLPLTPWIQNHKLTIMPALLSHCCYQHNKRPKNQVSMDNYSCRIMAFKGFQNIAPPHLSYFSLLPGLNPRLACCFFFLTIEHFCISLHVFLTLLSAKIEILTSTFYQPDPTQTSSPLPQGWPMVSPNA